MLAALARGGLPVDRGLRMTVSGFFLGVERSLTGRAWRPRLDPSGEARALAIAQMGGQGEMLARVLAGRGVGLDEVARHL